jgi:hypothetical protein
LVRTQLPPTYSHFAACRDHLENVLQLGSFYARLDEFVSHVLYNEMANAYVAALADGVDELLCTYRHAILQVQERFTSDKGELSLLSLRHFLYDFSVLLPDVLRLIDNLVKEGPTCARVMTSLQQRTTCGVPILQSCAARLLWHCQNVLLKHLEAWLVNGELIDSEFFIQQANGDGPESINIENSISGLRIAAELIPPSVSARNAEQILFIGKATRILKHGTQAIDPINRASMIYHEHIKNLCRDNVLDLAWLQSLVEKMHDASSSQLCELLQKHSALETYFDAVQALFLHARGDIYQELLGEAHSLLSKRPELEFAELEIMQALLHALIRCDAEDISSSISFKVRNFTTDLSTQMFPDWHPFKNKEYQIPAYDAWDGLCPQAKISWPACLLFSPSTLQVYCAMWQYMFRLKRAQTALDFTWKTVSAASSQHMQQGRNKAYSGRLFVLLGQLRSRMAHFITNLASYLRFDVVEGASIIFRSTLVKAKSFTEMEMAHNKFVATLASRACFDVPQLMSAVEAIFSLCQRFCQLANEVQSSSIEVEDALVIMSELDWKFGLKLNVVLQLLQSSKLQDGPNSASLRQLVLQLNFNGFCQQEAVKRAYMIDKHG